ncbi:MAG: glutamine synthetase III [Candidatus Cloacimonetes bacterium]|nr:glutamine synthetase III [Candidatus Cloacimonadota bacterium]
MPDYPIVEDFGKFTFSKSVMKQRLPRKIFQKLWNNIENGQRLDRSLADNIAHAMKEWALENGATHYCHWFQPLTGATAEKHDSFLNFRGDGAYTRFSGNELIQGEPDASSFPSGGARCTFEARGYTAWDPSSPAFLMEGQNGKFLAIPSIFVSYKGEALGKKLPLLKSMKVISDAGTRALSLFGKEVKWVRPTLGAEQEYFLVSRKLFNERLDLKLTGRTLIGSPSPKDQQLDDHYFGAIPDGVLAFMEELDKTLLELGIPAKTRHNEVAPSQFELAVVYNFANVAADNNQLLMNVIESVAHKHDYEALLHEKPFAGINGSGKHNNWSLEDSNGNNILEPGKTPATNYQFLLFLAAILDGVHKYEGLIRSAIATAGNDHRLGANEAPPAIISVFLGEQLTNIVDSICNGNDLSVVRDAVIDAGLDSVIDINKDKTDRNRTSPFAFTGNKFEFRAVGSQQSVSIPQTFINVAVAESLSILCDQIEKGLESNTNLVEVLMPILKESFISSTNIRFEGDNYSKEWEEEAAKRGLSNNRKTPEALQIWEEQKNIDLLAKYDVMTPHELNLRYHVKLEQYSTKIAIEAHTLLKMVSSSVIPAAMEYQAILASSIDSINSVQSLCGLDDSSLEIQGNALKELTTSLSSIISKSKELKEKLLTASNIENAYKMASFYCETILVLMDEIRDSADTLEDLVDKDLWRIPDYTDLIHSH